MADVGMLVGDRLAPTAADEIMRGLVEAQGHTVTYESSSATNLAAWAGALDLVVVTASADPSLVGTQLRTSPTKVIVLAAGGGGGARWSNFGIAGTLSSSSNSTWGVQPGVSGFDIVANLTGNFDAWTSGSAVSHFALASTLPAGAVPLYRQGATDNTKVTGLHVPTGTTLVGGGTAGARYGLAGATASVELYSGAPARWRDLFTALVVHALPVVTPTPPAPIVSIANPGSLTVGVGKLLDVTVDLNGGSAITTIAWTVAPTTGLTFSSTTVEDPIVTATEAGTYSLTVTVTNADGQQDSASITLGASDVPVPNTGGRVYWNGTELVPVRGHVQYLGGGLWLDFATGLTFDDLAVQFPPPSGTPLGVSLAVDPTSVNEGSGFTLTASVTGGAGSPVATFSQLSGTSAGALSGTGLVRTGTAPEVAANETLVFQVEVTDGPETASDTVNLAVGNVPPVVANAGADQSATEGDTVTLTGSATGGNGGPYTYTWTQTAGTAVILSGTGASRTFTAPAVAGVLTFQVEASDGVLTDTDTVDVTVALAPVISTVGLAVADNGAGVPAANNTDLWIKTRLESLGYTVTYIADSVPTATSGTFDALFISPTCNAVDAGANHGSFTGPMVISHGAAWDDFTVSTGTVNSTTTDVGNIVGASHPIAVAAGLSAGTVTFLTAATATRNGLNVVGDAVMDLTTVSGSRILTALPAGGLNSSGAAVPARRVMIGFDSGIYNTSGSTRLNANGTALFDASVEWCYS